jgi:hypothetical protein
MESQKPGRKIHTHDEGRTYETSLQDATGNRTVPGDSTESLRNGSALSVKSTTNSTDISSFHKDLDETEDAKSQSIFNENSAKPLHVHSKNQSDITSDQLIDTSSDKNSKALINTYRDLHVSSRNRKENTTAENFSNRSEISAKGEDRMVGDQPTDLSAKMYNPYPIVATENAYIILRDMVSNPTELSTTQLDLSPGNSTEISNVQFSKDMGEKYPAISCKHSDETANELSEKTTTMISSQSTGEGSTTTAAAATTTTERPFTNVAADRSGKWNDIIRISSRPTRDNWGNTGRRMETSKLNASRNIDDTTKFSYITTDTSSSRQKSRDFRNSGEISSSTENGPTKLGAHLISITVQNSSQSTSNSPESASKTSSDSTRNYFNTLSQGTTRPSGGDVPNKNISVGEWKFIYFV